VLSPYEARSFGSDDGSVVARTKAIVCHKFVQVVTLFTKCNGMRSYKDCEASLGTNVDDVKTLSPFETRVEYQGQPGRAYLVAYGSEQYLAFPADTYYAVQVTQSDVLGSFPGSQNLYCGRHDFGTRVVRETGNLPAVMKTMGHKDVRTAMLYQHPELDIVREALDAPRTMMVQ
jgi:hypothetical protein